MSRIITPGAPALILPHRRRSMVIENAQGMGGEVAGLYRLQVRRPDGRVRIDTGWFKNLITDYGLERAAVQAFGGLCSQCCVGSGNTPPSTTDTTLVSEIAASSTLQVSTRGRTIIGSAPITAIYSKINRVFRFAAGVAAGNLSEVGMRASGQSLYSRALILDELGAPTTITILSDEVLDVSYEHRLYYDLNDYNDVITISGVNYNVLRRIRSYGGDVSNSWNPESQAMTTIGFSMDAHSGAIGPITSAPGGSASGPDANPTADAYVPNSKTRRWHATWGLNNGNFAGGIRCISFWHTPGWTQMEFTPTIPKDSTRTLTMDFDSSPWGRYSP
jgi:hypothetical protein